VTLCNFFSIAFIDHIHQLYIMGRSAKFAKRPTKKEKVASKTAKESRKPLPRQPSPVENKGDEEGAKGPKKRKMMRAKVDQVSGQYVTTVKQ
jgi:hypothetical protein